MATPNAEGIWGCKVLSGKRATDKGATTVEVVAQITDGPNAGARVVYRDTVNAKSVKYIKWSLQAVGWKAVTFESVDADVAAWIKETGGMTTLEIQHIVTRKGTPEEGIWDKVKGLGRGAPKPLGPPSKQADAEADKLLGSLGGSDADEAAPF